MNRITDMENTGTSLMGSRAELVAGLPVLEERHDFANISTSVFLGGDGPEIILLHGPGENALWWMRLLPFLITDYRIILPDLPGHGNSAEYEGSLNADRVFAWLNELIAVCCKNKPVLAGHLLGGAIGARYAINNGQKLRRLVLVDSLGLEKFRPSLGFAYGLLRFMYRPTEKNYSRFLPQCLYDIENLKVQMGDKWDHFIRYNLECANDRKQRSAMKELMKNVGIPKINTDELAGIKFPVSLIWGRYDRANKLEIAVKARKKYDWPLYIIEKTRDDPKLEQPKEFAMALSQIMAG